MINHSKLLNFTRSFLLFFVMLSALLFVHQHVVEAQTISDVLEGIEETTDLEGYTTTVHEEASTRSGVKNITSAIFFAIDFLKFFLGGVAVIMIFIQAIYMVTAGKEAEEKITRGKNYMKYALFGLVIIFVADEAVKLAFFGEEGEFLRSQEDAIEYATAGGTLIEGLYTAGEVFLAAIAVLMIVYSGFQILVAGASEEAVNNAKKRIFMASIGLVIIGLSEAVVKDVIFVDQGSNIDVGRGKEIIAGIANFLVSVIGTLSVAAFVYAGFLYILNFGNEEMTSKAKKIMFGAVAGIVLAAAAFAVVSTTIPVEGAE